MATLMMRHRCGLRAEVVQRPCSSCGGFGKWTPEETQDPAPAPEGRVREGEPSPWTCIRCDRDNPPARADCLECAEPRPAGENRGRGVTIEGDAGRHSLLPGSTLPIGRLASFSPVADALRRFDNVSRRHALLGAGVDGRVTVTDLKSSNGTWLVGPEGLRRIDPGSEVTLAPGTTLQLGNDRRAANARLSIVAQVDG